MATAEKLNEMVFTANWEDSQTEIPLLGGCGVGEERGVDLKNCLLAKHNI